MTEIDLPPSPTPRGTIEVWLGIAADYIRALKRHMVAFISGSVVSVVLQFVAAYGIVLPFWTYSLVFLVGGLSTAGFFIWREEKESHGDELAGRDTAHALLVGDLRQVHGKEMISNNREHVVALENLRQLHEAELARAAKAADDQVQRALAEIARLQAKLDEKPVPPLPVMYFHSKDPQCLARDNASQTLCIKVTNEGGQAARVLGLSLDRVVVDGQERRVDKSAFFPLLVPNGAFECEIPPFGASRYFRILYQTGQHATHGAMTEFAPKGLREPKFPAMRLDLTFRLQADFGEPLKTFSFVARPKGDAQWGFLDYADEAIGSAREG